VSVEPRIPGVTYTEGPRGHCYICSCGYKSLWFESEVERERKAIRHLNAHRHARGLAPIGDVE